ncbi:MAG: hypothetical protein CSA81_12995 [Acidobacteria bacterium]|nr:MAG: hypothetical protein CSA81_12995 [Acidobacteriota bacterium]
MPFFLVLMVLALFFTVHFTVVYRLCYLLRESSLKKSLYWTFASLLSVPLLLVSFAFETALLNAVCLYYTTFIFLLFFITLFYMLVFRIGYLKGRKKLELSLVFLTLFLYVSYGIVNANRFVVKEVHLESAKVHSPVTFVQLTDTHIGSKSPVYFDKLIEEVNALEKDFVVITGDLIDMPHIQFNDLKALNTISVPVFFVMGNHDVMARMSPDFFKASRVMVLNNEKAVFNEDLDITGINFYDPDNAFETRKVEDLISHIDLDNSKFNLALNHEPIQLQPVIDREMDLQVSGHTHSGQIFPFNYVVKLRYDYLYGLFKLSEHTQLYVSSGAGVWGPNMRVGSKNEIVLFKIKPKNR